MTSQQMREPKTCGCLPFRDPLLITAQVLSIVGLLLSWSTIVSLIFGVVAFVLYQVVWCCRMNKCGIITMAAFAVSTGVCCIVVGSIIAGAGTTRWCTATTTYVSSFGFDDDIWVQVAQANDDACQKAVTIVSAIGFAGGVVWIACAVCTFVFVCGPRYAKFQQAQSETDDNIANIVRNNQTTADTDVPVIVDVEKGREDNYNDNDRDNTVLTGVSESLSSSMQSDGPSPKKKKKMKKKSTSETVEDGTKKKNPKKKQKKSTPQAVSQDDENGTKTAKPPTKKKKKKKTAATSTATSSNVDV